MVTDRREYIRLDVAYLDNPKIAEVLDESHAAVVLHIASMALARQHRTDGVVSRRQLVRKVGATDADADILLRLGLWHDVGGGKVEVHDYAKHQETKEQIEARSAAAIKANRTRWNSNPIPIGSDPESESDSGSESGSSKLGIQRRGEERRGKGSGGRLGHSTTEATEKLEKAGLPPEDHNNFLQALKDRGIDRPLGFVTKATMDALVTRIKEWRDERDRAARAPRVLTATIAKAPRDDSGRAVYEPETCPHDGEVGRCPMCRTNETIGATA